MLGFRQTIERKCRLKDYMQELILFRISLDVNYRQDAVKTRQSNIAAIKIDTLGRKEYWKMLTLSAIVC